MGKQTETGETHRVEGHVRTEADWRDVTTSQGMPRVTNSHQKQGKRHETILPQPPEGTNNADTLIEDVWLITARG